MEQAAAEGDRWYWAELVEEIRIAGEPGNIVHLNTLLVRAASPQQAYDRALELGRNAEIEYCNTAGQPVTVRFCGIADLDVIHDDLEHGAELWYREQCDVSEAGLQALIRPREALRLFQAHAQEGRRSDQSEA